MYSRSFRCCFCTFCSKQNSYNKVRRTALDNLPYKNLIQNANPLLKNNKRTSNQPLWKKIKALGNEVVSEIRLSKTHYFDKLEDVLSKENVNAKLFWKSSKQIIGLSKTSHTIPTLRFDNKYAKSNIDKANMLNEYFSSQSVVYDINKSLP